MKSDIQTRLNVLEELIWEPETLADNVIVEVTDGKVVLTGYTDTESQRWHAEKAAARVHGVTQIENQIYVLFEQGASTKV